MSHHCALAFLQPVDAEELGLDDYYEKIKVWKLKAPFNDKKLMN